MQPFPFTFWLVEFSVDAPVEEFTLLDELILDIIPRVFSKIIEDYGEFTEAIFSPATINIEEEFSAYSLIGVTVIERVHIKSIEDYLEVDTDEILIHKYFTTEDADVQFIDEVILVTDSPSRRDQVIEDYIEFDTETISLDES